jgi:hypothetical protein
MIKTILVTLGLFQYVEFKTVKVFDTIMNSIIAKGLMVVGRRGYGLFYTGTDLAQPIRVVRDSCVKG